METYEPDPIEPLEAPAPRVGARTLVYVLAVAAILLTFFAAYAYAARGVAGADSIDGGPLAAGTSQCAACSAGGCGGSAPPGEAPSGTAVLDVDVQRIVVDVSKGYFDPTTITLAAGVPAEITFSEGSGCLAEVMFPQFGIREDLTTGGAVVDIPALEAGSYPFSCGMEMVFGVLVVE